MTITRTMLNNGDICVLRNGIVCVVLPNDNRESGLALFGREKNGNDTVCKKQLSDVNYTDDLKFIGTRSKKATHDLDIVAVYKADSGKPEVNTLMKHVYGTADRSFNMENFEWDWELNPVKKMTLEQIEAALGYKVKLM